MVYEKLIDGVWTEAQPTDEEIGQTPLGFDWILWKRRKEAQEAICPEGIDTKQKM